MCFSNYSIVNFDFAGILIFSLSFYRVLSIIILIKMEFNTLINLPKIFDRVKNFSKTYWACALAGEVGELCNLIKKEARDKLINYDEIQLECADIFNYLAIISRIYRFDLEQAILRKLRIVNNREK